MNRFMLLMLVGVTAAVGAWAENSSSMPNQQPPALQGENPQGPVGQPGSVVNPTNRSGPTRPSPTY